MAKKRKAVKQGEERPASLLLWPRDGCCYSIKPRVTADAEVSIGRTNSKRGLGFLVRMKNGKRLVRNNLDFVLDRDQVAELAAYLGGAKGRLRKPLGRKPPGFSLAAFTPKLQLHNILVSAAMEAHPGWHDLRDGCWERDAGTPRGTRLVAWFKKTHPRDAARIERGFTERLWNGD